MALWFCAGHKHKLGNKTTCNVRAAGRSLEWLLCETVSSAKCHALLNITSLDGMSRPFWSHVQLPGVSLRRILYRRSLVGMKSCTALNHSARVEIEKWYSATYVTTDVWVASSVTTTSPSTSPSAHMSVASHITFVSVSSLLVLSKRSQIRTCLEKWTEIFKRRFKATSCRVISHLHKTPPSFQPCCSDCPMFLALQEHAGEE
jgi:hypothetical protein